jgi:hypothetical protein
LAPNAGLYFLSSACSLAPLCKAAKIEIPWFLVVWVRFFIATHMSAHCVNPAIASVVSEADAAGYGWWVAGLDVDWETVGGTDLATFDHNLRTRWNGMKPEERAKLNAEAAEAIAALARDPPDELARDPLDEACSREIQWMKRAEAEDRERDRMMESEPKMTEREREEMERAVAREVKGFTP